MAISSIDEERRRRRKGGGGKQTGGGGSGGGVQVLMLPIVKVIGGELPRVVDEAEAALIAAGGFNLYQRAGEIVRPILEELPGVDDTYTKSWRIAPIARAHLRECLTQSAHFVKFNTKEEEVTVNCPADVVETYMGRVGLWKLRPLVGTVNTPLLRADGSLLDAPGYDQRTGLLFEPEGQLFPSVPSTPSKDDAASSLDLILDLLRTFPFVTPADQAVAVSAVLTAVARRSMRTAPLHGFDAPIAASGKSLLVDVASVIATGRPVGVINQGKNDQEMEARIVGALLAGHAMVSLDNCDRPLGGPMLCQALSQERANLRRLGDSDLFDTPMNACFFATGNNLTLVDDMVRRTLRCSIDPRVERPELREFDGDLLAQVRAARGEYVCAALTVLRAYQVAGMPDRLRPLGSFEQWSDRVRSALFWLGMKDPCETMIKAGADDPVKAMLGMVIAQWKIAIGARREVTTHDIIKIANEDVMGDPRYPELKTALSAVGSKGRDLDARRLGEWLRGIKGRMVGGMRIMKASEMGHGGATKWYLE